jgi:SAM-dependent methyltransferase
MSEHSDVGGAGTAKEVKAMYEAYPYPSPVAGYSVIDDTANSLYSLYGEQSLRGRRILDAGCGTGHRLVATAMRYPNAQFIGVDMTAAALEVADLLARKHNVKNIRFEQGDLLDLHLSGEFDLVISSGVIHHLEDPQRGLRNLASLLAPDGLLVVWLYNAVGEHDRLMSRELLHLMWSSQSGIDRGVQTMRDLGLQLEIKRYGRSAAQRISEVSQLNIDVDAFIHPIVNAYSFEQAIRMCGSCRELGWAAINNINLVGASKLIDLAEAEQSEMRYLCQSTENLFNKDSLQERFRGLEKMDKLRVIEIKLKPTGFTTVAGRGRSYKLLGPRLVGNALEF